MDGVFGGVCVFGLVCSVCSTCLVNFHVSFFNYSLYLNHFLFLLVILFRPLLPPPFLSSFYIRPYFPSFRLIVSPFLSKYIPPSPPFPSHTHTHSPFPSTPLSIPFLLVLVALISLHTSSPYALPSSLPLSLSSPHSLFFCLLPSEAFKRDPNNFIIIADFTRQTGERGRYGDVGEGCLGRKR